MTSRYRGVLLLVPVGLLSLGICPGCEVVPGVPGVPAGLVAPGVVPVVVPVVDPVVDPDEGLITLPLVAELSAGDPVVELVPAVVPVVALLSVLVPVVALLSLSSPWVEAANALAAGDQVRAADLYAEIGSLPDEADARLKSGREDQVRRALIRDVLVPLAGRFPTPPEEAGFADGRLHSFRHFFCSLCASRSFLVGVIVMPPLRFAPRARTW